MRFGRHKRLNEADPYNFRIIISCYLQIENNRFQIRFFKKVIKKFSFQQQCNNFFSSMEMQHAGITEPWSNYEEDTRLFRYNSLQGPQKRVSSQLAKFLRGSTAWQQLCQTLQMKNQICKWKLF